MSSLILSPVEALVAKNREQLVYIAHLNALLLEACTILDSLEVTTDVSEHLAHWWEHHRPVKEEDVNKIILSESIAVGSGVDDQGLRSEDDNPVGRNQRRSF